MHLFHVQQYVNCILLVVFENNYGIPFSLWLFHYSFNIQIMIILKKLCCGGLYGKSPIGLHYCIYMCTTLENSLIALGRSRNQGGLECTSPRVQEESTFLLSSRNAAAYAQILDVSATNRVQRDLEHRKSHQAFPLYITYTNSYFKLT